MLSFGYDQWQKTLQKYKPQLIPLFRQVAIILEKNSLSMHLLMNKFVYDALEDLLSSRKIGHCSYYIQIPFS